MGRPFKQAGRPLLRSELKRLPSKHKGLVFVLCVSDFVRIKARYEALCPQLTRSARAPSEVNFDAGHKGSAVSGLAVEPCESSSVHFDGNFEAILCCNLESSSGPHPELRSAKPL